MARKVRGYGDVELLGDEALRPGGQFLAYVELKDWPFLPGIGDQVRAHAGTASWCSTRRGPRS